MKIILAMVLLCSTCTLYAQTPTQFFETFPGDVTRQFTIALEQGESMQLELEDIDDLKLLPNVDSLVAMIVNELTQLPRTKAQMLYGRRLDYIIAGEETQVRFREGTGRDKYYNSSSGKIMALKFDEDTVTISGEFKAEKSTRFYRISFFLNELDNLAVYNNGQLQQKIELLIAENNQHNKKWLRSKDGTYYLKNNPDITAPTPGGRAGGTDLLLFRPSVDIQNYRDHFVPSITVGLAVVKRRNSFYQEYGLSSEVHFRFVNSNGTSKTLVQSFITLSYGQSKIASNMKFPTRLFPSVSLSYLTRGKGDLYEKNTFRLGLGRLLLGKNLTRIEPSLYMYDFFKDVTPSLRLVQGF